MTDKLIVAIVDDDDAVRLSLKLLIETLAVETRGYASARAFLEDARRAEVGCLVLDMRMPGMSGLDLQSRLAAEAWVPPIVFISGHADVPTAVQAMRGGAVDFLQKPFSDQALLDRIQQALETAGALRRAAEVRRTLQARLALLSVRESEVMQRVVAGQMNKVIASELNISIKTVEDHRAAIMRKMRARNVQDLVRMVAERG